MIIPVKDIARMEHSAYPIYPELSYCQPDADHPVIDTGNYFFKTITLRTRHQGEYEWPQMPDYLLFI